MNFLIDTNIISELRKGDRCDANVAAWFAGVMDAQLFLSVLVLGEIRRGAEILRRRDAIGASAIDRWLSQVRHAFVGRILPVDAAVADEWGRIGSTRTLPTTDGLLAATARVNGLTLVTRNTKDVKGLGADLLDPFEPTPPTRR